MNAQAHNATSAAARKSPVTAGQEDGFYVGMTTTGRVRLVDYADPRWVCDRRYREAFRVGFRGGRAERRWQDHESA